MVRSHRTSYPDSFKNTWVMRIHGLPQSDVKLRTTSLVPKFSDWCYVCNMEKVSKYMRLQQVFYLVFTAPAHFLLISLNCLLSMHTHTHNTSPGQKITNCLWNTNGLFKGRRTAEFYHLRMKRKKLNQGYRFFHSHKSYNELTLNQTISDIEALMVYTAWENFYECGHILKY